MMNRSNSADSYVPSIMSFVGLEATRLQPKPHLWDWDANNTTNNPSVDIPTILTPPTNQPFLDYYPQPPLLPTTTFPFYPVIKREEGLGLNLGHRTYFSSADAPSVDLGRGAFYSLGQHQHHNPPRCQAEGCKADLSGAKHYHRRHKVCDFHSKAAFVVAGGMQKRFCQQCSRFHVLSEFDESKRSCRKRLADHNRRRRKPPQLQHQDIPAPKNHILSPASTSKPSTSMKTSSTLSLGGVREERMGWAAQSIYHHQHQQQQQLSLFNHHNAYNEATQPTGSDHQQNSLLNLGFEVDFM